MKQRTAASTKAPQTLLCCWLVRGWSRRTGISDHPGRLFRVVSCPPQLIGNTWYPQVGNFHWIAIMRIQTNFVSKPRHFWLICGWALGCKMFAFDACKSSTVKACRGDRQWSWASQNYSVTVIRLVEWRQTYRLWVTTPYCVLGTGLGISRSGGFTTGPCNVRCRSFNKHGPFKYGH